MTPFAVVEAVNFEREIDVKYTLEDVRCDGNRKGAYITGVIRASSRSISGSKKVSSFKNRLGEGT